MDDQNLSSRAVALGLAIVSEGMRVAWERAVSAEREKDLLFQELAHRTKNNLAMIISLLSLQARSKTNSEARVALEKAVARIQAIAGAHDHLNATQHGDRVEMQPYLEQLCNHLGDTLRDVRPIALDMAIGDVHLSTKQAIPLGLIVNELVTNAFKHAFPDGRPGTVKVYLTQSSPVILTVEDNGVGCASGRQEKLGSRLMQLLAQQLGAAVKWEPTDRGCRVRLEFAPS